MWGVLAGAFSTWETRQFATILASAAAAATAALAWRGLVVEGRRTRLSLGLDNLWRLIDKWDSPEMHQKRADLASAIKSDPSLRREISNRAIDVLNTFELLGYLVLKSRTLRLEDAWVNFSSWAVPYYYLLSPAIEESREADKTVFEDFKALVERFIDYEMDARELPRNDVIPSSEILLAFVEAEAVLLERDRGRGLLERIRGPRAGAW